MKRVFIASIVGLMFCCFMPAQDLSASIDSLKSEIEKDPGAYELHFKLGNCYYALGEYEQALQEFHYVEDLKPEYFAAQFKAALCYYHMDSMVTARAELERLRDMQPAYKHIYLWLADTYGSLGLYNEMIVALGEYKRLAGKDFFHGYSTRDYYDIEVLIAKAYAMRGRFDDAIKYYRSVIDDYWGPYYYDILLAMIYEKKGESINSEKWYTKAFTHLDHYYDYYGLQGIGTLTYALLYSKSIFLWLLGRFDDAVAAVDSMGPYTKLEAIDVYNLGVFRIAAGDVHGLDDLRHASAIDPDRFSAFYDALVSVKDDSLSKALTILAGNKKYLDESGIGKALYAHILEESGHESTAQAWWYKCYGRLPLGTDVESMKNFTANFVATVRKKP